MNDEQLVVSDLFDGVLRIELNRPDKRNAITSEMMATIDSLLDEAEKADDVRAVTLTGRGKVFCAGHDMTRAVENYRQGNPTSRPVPRALPKSWYFSKPFIAGVHGYVGPGGMEITAGCDFIIAGEKTRWSFEQTRMGGIAPSGVFIVLNQQLPMRVVNKLWMMGGWFSAEDALGWNFVQRVLPPEQVAEETHRWALEAAKIPLVQYSSAKQSIRRVYELFGLSSAVGVQNMVSGHGSNRDKQFWDTIAEHGMKRALQDRDNNFDQSIAQV
jgi:2-(1,2-epoxy-1,2-dihydrophenyl)acetyl-CoA isomerase